MLKRSFTSHSSRASPRSLDTLSSLVFSRVFSPTNPSWRWAEISFSSSNFYRLEKWIIYSLLNLSVNQHDTETLYFGWCWKIDWRLHICTHFLILEHILVRFISKTKKRWSWNWCSWQTLSSFLRTSSSLLLNRAILFTSPFIPYAAILLLTWCSCDFQTYLK